jgi:hypothetical protein
VHDFHPVGFARFKEPNYVYIDHRYFLQVQNQPRPVILELLFQFPDVLQLKVPDQTNRGPAAARIPFDLQVRLPRLKLTRRESMQLVCHGNSLNRHGVTAQEVAERSEIPDCSGKLRRNVHCHSLVEAMG